MPSFDAKTLAYLYNFQLMNSRATDKYIKPTLPENELIIILNDVCDQKMMNKMVDFGLKSHLIDSNGNMMTSHKEMLGGAIGGALVRKQELGGTDIRYDGPKKDVDWLSTTHINNIMKYYQEKFPEFEFLGAVPQDCYQYDACALHNTPFDQLLQKGKTKIGIIFNLDDHRGGGSHWVALWLNLVTGQCYYCDSVGKKPLSNSQEYIDSFCAWFKRKYKKEADFRINKFKYQKDSSECGVYSCNFIIRMLNGEESFDDITKNSLDFKEINSCRNVYFQNKPSKYEPEPICDPITFEHTKDDLKKS